jgi:hypothetical protein
MAPRINSVISRSFPALITGLPNFIAVLLALNQKIFRPVMFILQRLDVTNLEMVYQEQAILLM